MMKQLIFIIFCMAVVFSGCIKDKIVEPKKDCIDDQPVEDTTRVYIRNIVDVDGTVVKADTVHIYPKAVYARFYPWIIDTTKIRQLAEKHHLRLLGIGGVNQQFLTAILCVNDSRRAEYHFTPYGKEGFCNFGADSLVEYSFGIFSYGFRFPPGNIVFKFKEGTPQTRIDSLFQANGLRFLYKHPDYPSGYRYSALVTPRAKKNVLDLGNELNFIPFVIYASTEWATGGNPINCDE